MVLLGDPYCRVSALVENPAHDIGVISASGPLDTSLVELTYLSGNAVLKPGQNVVTSGDGGIYPRGIPIGQIVDSQTVEFGLYTEARVKLSANLGALEQVWVLFPMNAFNPILILAAAFLAVFGEAAFPLLRHWLGAQVDLLPGLMVYTALNTDIVTVSLLADLGRAVV